MARKGKKRRSSGGGKSKRGQPGRSGFFNTTAGRAVKYGAAAVAVLGVAAGVSASLNVESGLKKGLVYGGAGLLGAAAAKMLFGKTGRQFATPLLTVGLALGLAEVANPIVSKIAEGTANTLGNASFGGGSSIAVRPVAPQQQVSFGTAPALPAPQPQQVIVQQAAQPWWQQALGGVIQAAPGLISSISAATRPVAAAGVDSWGVPVGANGVENWGVQGAGYMDPAEYVGRVMGGGR